MQVHTDIIQFGEKGLHGVCMRRISALCAVVVVVVFVCECVRV
jgi:hypothetical protein